MKRLSLLTGLVAVCVSVGVVSTPAALGAGDARYSVSKQKMDDALACQGGKASLDGKGKRQPVLLVPGTGITREETYKWNYWKVLPTKGFEVCWVELPKSSLSDIQISSEYVARAVGVMHRRSGERIDVLGHSQGGIQPRWAIKWFPSGRHIGDYIGLASPNHGTTAADDSTELGSAPPSFWQLRRQAKLIGALNEGDETPGRTFFTNIYTDTDELVRPVGTQDLKGGSNILLQDVCPGRPVDHLSIVGDGLTYLLVIDALLHAGPAKASRLPADRCEATTVPGADAPPPEYAPDYTKGSLVDEEPRLKPYAR